MTPEETKELTGLDFADDSGSGGICSVHGDGYCPDCVHCTEFVNWLRSLAGVREMSEDVERVPESP